MTTDAVCGVGARQLVVGYDGATVPRLAPLVRATVILLPLMRYVLLVIRSLML